MFSPLNIAVENNKKAQISINKTRNIVRIFGRMANILVLVMYFLYIMFFVPGTEIDMPASVAMLIVLPLLANALFTCLFFFLKEKK